MGPLATAALPAPRPPCSRTAAADYSAQETLQVMSRMRAQLLPLHTRVLHRCALCFVALLKPTAQAVLHTSHLIVQ